MPMPDLSRRQLLRSAGAAALAATAAASGAVSSAATAASSAASSAGSAVAAAARRTTLAGVIGKAAPGPGGYTTLVAGPGEKHVVRTDLGVKPKKGRVERRRGVLAFAQLSDIHVTDAQSPLRVEWVDRWDDEDAENGPTGLLSSSYRPHEMLAAHIADSMVREINAIGKGPVTGKPLALAVQTGDNSDNAQLNEIRWNIDVLDGGEVRIDSGDPEKWEGVADLEPGFYDIHYYHPDPLPEGVEPDRPRAKYGFPAFPGLLDAARRPFTAEGLKMPWISVFGNHDGLVQGNFPTAIEGLSAVATGSTKVISPPVEVSKGEVLLALATGRVTEVLQKVMSSPGARTVTPDPDRRLLTRGEVVAEHFTTKTWLKGHGFTQQNVADGTAYYTLDRGRIRFVGLDTVNLAGGSNGSIDRAQHAWLKSTLKQAKKDKKLVVVCSHHTSTSMDNDAGGDRVLGDELVETLLAHPNVVAWVNGHTHTNNVWARKKATGKGGFWEINTASHIDWPQQSRLIEIANNKDRTLSIFATMVDHGGPVAPDAAKLDDTHALASIGRELAANDWHERAVGRTGTRQDRNVELLIANPLRW
ncbi:metallophosphoesterase [Nocardioides deserti]|nr:metallophosphoesterase [Nocardioides deserti]